MLAPQTGLLASLLLAGSTLCAASAPHAHHEEKIAPKVFIVSMVWENGTEIWEPTVH
jgi:hypothetical protein